MASDPENLGRRIAGLRADLGWTQQKLADRLAMSRVAVSHLEAGMSVASERTIVLLAGVFKVEPYELVAGTNYPQAKAERLPGEAARYTEVELQLALLERDLAWLGSAERDTEAPARRRVLDEWRPRLRALTRTAAGDDATEAIEDARRKLEALDDSH